MGQQACKPLPKILRKAGDPMNVFSASVNGFSKLYLSSEDPVASCLGFSIVRRAAQAIAVVDRGTNPFRRFHCASVFDTASLGKGIPTLSLFLVRAASLVSDLPSVHQEIVYPTHKRTLNFSICRCWQSTKFPICDNSHKVLQKQGCNCGPAMLEVRQAPSVVEPREFRSTSGNSKEQPSAGVLFGGAASVAAAVAG
ncbi:Clone ZZD536 mRNA sequence-like protein, related [Eimeria praecox]|uniref:Clone ZZD536 mRNA sequence-like protein, related n=1 Tax=Eimeria praecox TaxID=51316 RepID=U6G7E2_9EIME|nr:Clone ZZD536 mRNA sequence-like protein, related [Eimeria praecox]